LPLIHGENARRQRLSNQAEIRVFVLAAPAQQGRHVGSSLANRAYDADFGHGPEQEPE
jgi:hypothetical protein